VVKKGGGREIEKAQTREAGINGTHRIKDGRYIVLITVRD